MSDYHTLRIAYRHGRMDAIGNFRLSKNGEYTRYSFKLESPEGENLDRKEFYITRTAESIILTSFILREFPNVETDVRNWRVGEPLNRHHNYMILNNEQLLNLRKSLREFGRNIK